MYMKIVYEKGDRLKYIGDLFVCQDECTFVRYDHDGDLIVEFDFEEDGLIKMGGKRRNKLYTNEKDVEPVK